MIPQKEQAHNKKSQHDSWQFFSTLFSDLTAELYDEKNHQLYLRQKTLLDSFLEHGAITQAQHDKSLHDLIEKMGEHE